MGNTSHPQDSNTSKPPEPIRSFYYLNRSTNSILRIHTSSVSKHSLQDFIIFPQSAIGYLPDGHIIIAGGQKPSGKLSKKVFYINTLTKDINRLASLRYPTKFGTILYHESQLYYFSPDLCDQHQVYSKKCWNPMQNGKLKLQDPSVFMRQGQAFFVCGVKPNGNPTKKIYYLNISETQSIYLIYPLKFPVRLEKPIVLANNSCLIVTGGRNAGERNCNFFFHWFGSEKWKEVQGPDFNAEDYPAIIANDAMIWVGFPKIVMICKNQFHIFNLRESQNQIVNISDYKSPRLSRVCPEIENCKNEIFFSKTENIPRELRKKKSWVTGEGVLISIPCDKVFDLVTPSGETEGNIIVDKEIVSKTPQKKNNECKLELNDEEFVGSVSPVSVQALSMSTRSHGYSHNPTHSVSQVIIESLI